jgi:hypothetical protein
MPTSSSTDTATWFASWRGERENFGPSTPGRYSDAQAWQRYLAKLANKTLQRGSTITKTRVFKMTLEANTIEPAAITAADKPTTMQKRTFFLIGKAGDGYKVVEKFTCDDVKQLLIVEQVDARLTGTGLTIDKLTETFPEAVRGAHYWSVMKTQAKADTDTLRGPFIIVTPKEPTEADLLTWYRTSELGEKAHVEAVKAPAKAKGKK